MTMAPEVMAEARRRSLSEEDIEAIRIASEYAKVPLDAYLDTYLDMLKLAEKNHKGMITGAPYGGISDKEKISQLLNEIAIVYCVKGKEEGRRAVGGALMGVLGKNMMDWYQYLGAGDRKIVLKFRKRIKKGVILPKPEIVDVVFFSKKENRGKFIAYYREQVEELKDLKEKKDEEIALWLKEYAITERGKKVAKKISVERVELEAAVLEEMGVRDVYIRQIGIIGHLSKSPREINEAVDCYIEGFLARGAPMTKKLAYAFRTFARGLFTHGEAKILIVCNAWGPKFDSYLDIPGGSRKAIELLLEPLLVDIKGNTFRITLPEVEEEIPTTINEKKAGIEKGSDEEIGLEKIRVFDELYGTTYEMTLAKRKLAPAKLREVLRGVAEAYSEHTDWGTKSITEFSPEERKKLKEDIEQITSWK